MKESPHININEEQERQQTIQCVIFAVIFVIGAFCALIYGFAWLLTTEKISEEVYGAKHLENRITVLEGEYKEHRHVYSTGKPKLKKVK